MNLTCKALFAVIFLGAAGLCGGAQATDTMDHAIELCQAKVANTSERADEADPNTMFCHGFVVALRDKNDAKAFTWFQKAADAGYAPGQYMLAQYYKYGRGTVANPAVSTDWNLKAALQGLSEAQYARGYALVYGEGDLRPDPAQAVTWLQKAADQGNIDARVSLADAYYNGRGVKQDFKKSFALYSQAAQNHSYAAYMLGIQCMDGSGVDKDVAAGFSWLLRSAGLNFDEAQLGVARSYAAGIGVAKDDVAAEVWFQIYQLNGHPEALPDREALEKTLTPEQLADAKAQTQARWAAMPKS
jgi:TPR repeat protein